MKKKYRKLERIALKLGESQGRSFFDKVIFKLKSERWIGANEVFRGEAYWAGRKDGVCTSGMQKIFINLWGKIKVSGLDTLRRCDRIRTVCLVSAPGSWHRASKILVTSFQFTVSPSASLAFMLMP